MQRFIREERPDSTYARQEQDALTYIAEVEEGWNLLAGGNARPRHRSAWLVQAEWTGAVAASASFSVEAVRDLSAFDDVVMAGWRECVQLLERLGGYGPAHLTLGISVAQPEPPSKEDEHRPPAPPPPDRGTLYAKLREETWVRRRVSVAEPDSDTLGSIQREVQRAARIESSEPEDEPPQAG
ncbi:MAG: hypothetical protein M3320_09650 [Actinomycetota bacterium]|nr:hypothetical protein [Actinomycetota bacterium]MDQ5808928.1 hypothetical protein [Actinomycetota bacterium]